MINFRFPLQFLTNSIVSDIVIINKADSKYKRFFAENRCCWKNLRKICFVGYDSRLKKMKD